MTHGGGPREVALRILHRADGGGAFVDDLLYDFLDRSNLSAVDKALVTELVQGTTRQRKRIDWVLAHFLGQKRERLTPWIRIILQLGAYQLLFLTKVPPFAAVSQSVQLAKRYGHHGTASLVNAVLRNIVRQEKEIAYPSEVDDPLNHVSVVYSHPQWMVQRWIGRYGVDQTIALCRANNSRPPLSVRMNAIQTSFGAFEAALHAEGVLFRHGSFLREFYQLEGVGDLRTFDVFLRGWFQVQDESAGLVSRLLDPRPGEVVVDLCAAPGGKATHLAELMGGQGTVLAVDRNRRRMLEVRDNCRRLGIDMVIPVVSDGRDFTCRHAHRVLVDAPCSGLGVLARRSDARWRKSPQDIRLLEQLQISLLEGAAALLRAGGVLVYSTCTIEPEENEEVVGHFLRSHPEFEVERADLFLPREVVDGAGYLRTCPHLHHMDGCFAVRMRKRS